MASFEQQTVEASSEDNNNILSQSSDLDKQALDEIENKAQAINTRKATAWGLKKIEKWSLKRNIKIDYEVISPTELNEILRKFYAEVKTEKGKKLTPSALTGIRAAIHRHITSAPISRNMNILQGSEFVTANKMFEAQCKLYSKEMNEKPKHKSPIEAGDMEKLNRYFVEGLDDDNNWKDSEKLLHFVWFSLAYNFGRRGREGWRELTEQSYAIKKDDTGARYVTEMLTEQTKNHQGGSKHDDQAYSDVRMYETMRIPNPVAAFEFYLQKRHRECPALFQTPNKKSCESKTTWYKKEPLSKNTISKLMENISVKAGLSRRYTNHCVRASTITALYQQGVDAKQICSITKHKDERSLNHYINQTTSAQKRKCSQLLDKAFRASTMETKAACSSKQSQRSEMLPSAMLSPTTLSATTSFHSTLNQNEFLSLSQPYPHCTQHIQIGTVNIYHGSPKQVSPEKKRRRIIINTDSESD